MAKSVLKASIPFVGTARRIKRTLRPYRPEPVHSGFAFADALEMIEALREAGGDLSGDVLEVGSGWTPIAPLLFHLAGARSVTLTDCERLYDHTSVPEAVGFVRARLDQAEARLGVAGAVLERRLGTFRPDYRCPWEPARHPAQSADVAISRAVLEHVPARAIAPLFAGLRRIVRPGGVMCHSIDHSDHWQHGPRGESLVDFLRYPSGSLRWRLASLNTQSYTNRLRHSDYLAGVRRAGWQVASERARVPETSLADVRRMRARGELAPEFAGREDADLAALATVIVARRCEG